jgi:aryl-alcohol dehydrogenase-like predicted oxidoreductase
VEAEYARLYTEYGLGTTIWSPLASGLLTGKHKQGLQEGTRATAGIYDWMKEHMERESRDKAEKLVKLEAVAAELGLPMAVLAIAWCLKNPHVSTVILGASKVAQLEENLMAIEAQAKLTPEVMKRIEEVIGKPK